MSDEIIKKAPWKKQRILKKEDIPVQEQVLDMAMSYSKAQERALFAMAYLTGGRISEIVRTPKLRKNTYKRVEITDRDGNKIKRTAYNDNGSPIIEKVEKYDLDYPGIRKKDVIFTEKKDKPIMIVSMHNRKNKNYKRKQIPIPIEKEGEFVDIIKDYLDRLEMPESPLFPFGISKAEKLIGQQDMNPHFLRDIRLTHMVQIYDFNTFQLIKFAGWQNTKPADRYIRLGVGDLIDKY